MNDVQVGRRRQLDRARVANCTGPVHVKVH